MRPRRHLRGGGNRLRFLLALLILASAWPIPESTAQGSARCDYYQTEEAHVPSTFFFTRLQAYRCEGMVGTTEYAQRVTILRIAERPAGQTWDDIKAQLEIHSLHTRQADGRENREHFVSLKDTAGTLGYTEVEHAESRQTNTCTARATLYRGSATTPAASTSAPCLPTLPLLP